MLFKNFFDYALVYIYSPCLHKNTVFRFRMKIFITMLSDTKKLIASIKAAHDQSNQHWLWIQGIDIGDKRANIGLLIYGKYQNFS